jgi:hypothetical protein
MTRTENSLNEAVQVLKPTSEEFRRSALPEEEDGGSNARQSSSASLLLYMVRAEPIAMCMSRYW